MGFPFDDTLVGHVCTDVNVHPDKVEAAAIPSAEITSLRSQLTPIGTAKRSRNMAAARVEWIAGHWRQVNYVYQTFGKHVGSFPLCSAMRVFLVFYPPLLQFRSDQPP